MIFFYFFVFHLLPLNINSLKTDFSLSCTLPYLQNLEKPFCLLIWKYIRFEVITYEEESLKIPNNIAKISVLKKCHKNSSHNCFSKEIYIIINSYQLYHNLSSNNFTSLYHFNNISFTILLIAVDDSLSTPPTMILLS